MEAMVAAVKKRKPPGRPRKARSFMDKGVDSTEGRVFISKHKDPEKFFLQDIEYRNALAYHGWWVARKDSKGNIETAQIISFNADGPYWRCQFRPPPPPCSGGAAAAAAAAVPRPAGEFEDLSKAELAKGLALNFVYGGGQVDQHD